MIRSIATLALSSISITSFAQAKPPAPVDPKDLRTIEVNIGGTAKGDTIYLANYYGNKLYYADTAYTDGKGNATFKSKRGYKAGVYAVVVPGPKYFELVVNEPVIKLATNKEDLLGALQVKQSKENEIFIGYIRYLNERKLQGDALRARLDGAKDPIARGAVKAEMEKLDAEVKQYQRDLIANNKGALAASLVRMSMAVELPEPRKPDGSLDSAGAYYQFRAHFWDHFDLADDRIVRVPVFANKFEEYFSKVVPQMPDSIAPLADALIARAGPSAEVFKYMVHTLTHKYENSDIMGMDAMFVHMALTYYCPKPGLPQRVDWMSAGKIDTLCTRARKMAPLTLGKKAPYLALPDTTEEKWINFYDLPQEYVVIIFWDPHCGHCKEELPKIHEEYAKTLRPMGIEVYAVAKAVEADLMRDWKKFIREKGLDWVNVALTQHVFEEARKDARQFIPKYTTLESLNYSDTYDVFSTPKLFVVDGERKFIGKSLTAEQIADLVRKLKERKAKKGPSDRGDTGPPPRIGMDAQPNSAASSIKDNFNFSRSSETDTLENVVVLGLPGQPCQGEITDQQAMADVLSQGLLHRYRVVERTQLESVFKEHKFQMSGLVDERSAIRAGALTGAEAVVVCRAACLDGENLYTAKLINCSTGKQIWACSGTAIRFTEFTEQLSSKLYRRY